MIKPSKLNKVDYITVNINVPTTTKLLQYKMYQGESSSFQALYLPLYVTITNLSFRINDIYVIKLITCS